MRIEQSKWSDALGWQPALAGKTGTETQLVLLFGSVSVLRAGKYWADLKQAFPQAHVLGCSTAGEIYGTQVVDDSLVATAVHFAHTQVQGCAIQLQAGESSFAAGKRLGKTVSPEGLVHVFVLSDGLQVNGSDLVKGLMQSLPEGVAITGGLSADGDRFQETLVLCDGSPRSGTIAALGFYGDRLKVGYGSMGGWLPFGPERMITASQGNTLYQLDGQPALQLYKKYLGERAHGLPATGLLFPLSLRTQTDNRRIVRTILSINEADQSLTFAGDLPQGSFAQLMHANVDRLVEGATGAAEISAQFAGKANPELAILVSCVGRKLLLQQRIEEEVEGVQAVIGEQAILTGFYSYGEISPFAPGAVCELHNQTMTVTTLSEV